MPTTADPHVLAGRRGSPHAASARVAARSYRLCGISNWLSEFVIAQTKSVGADENHSERKRTDAR